MNCSCCVFSLGTDAVTYLAILTGFPLLRDSSSASSCASRSIKFASAFKRRDLSKPETFLPHVVFNASRAAATARSMSFAEPGRKGRWA